MTERQRFIECLRFGAPDRVPLDPGSGRESTRAAWRSQGLPAGVPDTDIAEHAYRVVGGRMPWPTAPTRGFGVDHRMIPTFEERVLSRGERTQIVQDWKGNTCEISNEYTTAHLRNAVDFVTRRWIRCPVESRSDWEDMKRRYDPLDPARLPTGLSLADPELAERSWYLEVGLHGPFWQLREWLGFESLCLLFKDDPDFVREMIGFWETYTLRLLQRVFRYVVPDCVHLSEDMAFKGYSMISPTMVREYLLPCWRSWGEAVRGAGVPLYAVDSDGYVGELIPIWIEAGLNYCDPMEVAAGNDLAGYRHTHGRRMAYRGGVDKRAMAKGGSILDAEMDRAAAIARDGGYIPSCDHGIPPDVSWSNYLHYTRRLAEICGWL